MNPSIRLLRACVAVCFLVLSLSACSVSPHKPDASGQVAIEQRAQTQQLGTIEVRASVPGDKEARALFGIPLDKRGIQAVWLEIHNNSSLRARFAPYSLDPEYFPPYEVAYMHRKGYSTESHAAMERYLERLGDADQTDAQFYARADNLRYWLSTVNTRLGSLSQRLSASVGQRRLNTDLAGDEDEAVGFRSDGIRSGRLGGRRRLVNGLWHRCALLWGRREG